MSKAVGSYLENTMTIGEMSPQVFKPEVLMIDPEHEFRWKGKLFMTGIFDEEHYFLLESFGKNSTQLIHGERFNGILPGLLLRFIGDKTLKGFEAMNAALKTRCED